jgi:hypothetical protein
LDGQQHSFDSRGLLVEVIRPLGIARHEVPQAGMLSMLGRSPQHRGAFSQCSHYGQR